MLHLAVRSHEQEQRLAWQDLYSRQESNFDIKVMQTKKRENSHACEIMRACQKSAFAKHVCSSAQACIFF